jgi:hypothetical protein
MWKTGYQTVFVTIITFVNMVKFDAMVTLGIPAREKILSCHLSTVNVVVFNNINAEMQAYYQKKASLNYNKLKNLFVGLELS